MQGTQVMPVWVVVENLDNQYRRNNICLKGLIEEENLVGYLEELFIGCAGSDNKVAIKTIYAYQINSPRYKTNTLRDMMIKLADRQSKTVVQGVFWDTPMVNVDGSEISFYSDISPFTFKKRHSLQLLTSQLWKEKVSRCHSNPHDFERTVRGNSYYKCWSICA